MGRNRKVRPIFHIFAVALCVDKVSRWVNRLGSCDGLFGEETV